MDKTSSAVRYVRFSILLFFFFLPLVGLTLTDAQPSLGPSGLFEATAIDFDEFPGAIIARDGTIESAIIVAKETHPAGSAQSFSFTGDVTGSIGDGQALVVTGLPPGDYSSSEVVPSGWRLNSITCSHQADLFSISRADDLLRRLDPTTGATLGSVPITLAGETIFSGNGLATHPATGVLWAILKLSGQAGRELVTIDPATGVATSVGDTGEAFAGIAFNVDGSVLYGVTGDGGSPSETLFTLDQANATPTPLLTLGNGTGGETIAFNPTDGLIYHASGLGSKIFETVDPISFAITDVPLSGDDYSEATGLTYDPLSGSFLLGDLSARFFGVTTTGVVTQLGNTDHISKGLAFRNAGYPSSATAFFNLQAGEILLCLFLNEETLFVDGFESGNTDAWTMVVP